MIEETIVTGALQTFFYSEDDSASTNPYLRSVSYLRSNAIADAWPAKISTQCAYAVTQHSINLTQPGFMSTAINALSINRDLLLSRSLCNSYITVDHLTAELFGAMRFSEENSLHPKSSTIDSFELEAETHINKLKFFESHFSRRRALDYMYELLEDAFAAKKLAMIDELLLSASHNLIGTSIAISFLRATQRAKDRLTFWPYFYYNIKASLDDNPEAKTMLRGLESKKVT